MPPRIAVLGAPGTGRTRLSHELASHLRTRGHRVAVVSGREAGDDAPHAHIVIEDTATRQALDLDHPRTSALTLLMGLDLPLEAPAEASSREQADARLRQALTQAGIGWRVIYGQGEERVRQALDAVAAVLPWAWDVAAREQDIGRWSRLRASCEKCADADCEHRLFTGGALRLTVPPT